MRYVIEQHKKRPVIYPQPPQTTEREITKADGSVETVQEYDYGEKLIYESKVKELIKKDMKIDSDLEAMYSVVWGQCTQGMQASIKTQETYDNIKSTMNTIELLKIIKKICYNFQEVKYSPASVHTIIDRFINCKQKEEESNQTYLQRYNNAVTALETNGITVLASEVIAKQEHKDYDSKGTEEQEELKEEAAQRFFAYGYLKGMDKARYGSIKEELHNEYLKGQKNYPKTITDAYQLQQNYWIKKRPSKDQHAGSATNFMNRNARTKDNKDIECWTCGEKGHISPNCPNKNKDKNNDKNEGPNSAVTNVQHNNSDENKNKSSEGKGANHFQVSTFNFLQVNNTSAYIDSKIEGHKQPNYNHVMKAYQEYKCAMSNNGDDTNPKTLREWMLLDSQSTIDIFCNEDLLTKIHWKENGIALYTNAGNINVNRQGYLEGYGWVWFDNRAITNILCMNNVKKRFKITYNSEQDDIFHVHKEDRIIDFVSSDNGLYYHNTKNRQMTMVNTIAKNKENYTQQQIKRADEVQKLYKMTAHPTMENLIKMLEEGHMRNCTLTRQDVLNSFDIYGKELHGLKGKTQRQKPPALRIEYTPVPTKILQLYQNVVLAIDLFFVNNLPFLHTVSEYIKFHTTEHMITRDGDTIMQGLEKAIAVYNRRGFKIDTITADPEFDKLQIQLETKFGVKYEQNGSGDHVPLIENANKTIKQRIRSVWSTLPYREHMPRLITQELVGFATVWVNTNIPKNGISKTMSPREIMTGVKMDYKKHCKAPFGCYAQVYQGTDNSMTERTVAAICLGPTFNQSGSYKFMKLESGRMIKKTQFVELPMPDDVILHVMNMGKKQRGPRGLIFKNKQGAITEQYTTEIAGVYSDVTGVDEGNNDMNNNIILDNDIPLEDTYQDIQENNFDQDIYSEFTDEYDADREEINAQYDTEVPPQDKQIIDLTDLSDDEGDEEEEIKYVKQEEDLPSDIEKQVRAMEEMLENEIKEIGDTQNENHDIEEEKEQIEEPDIESLTEEINAIDETYTTRYGRESRAAPSYVPEIGGKKYAYNHAQLAAYLMQQLSLKEGLKKFGDKGDKAAYAEMEQLHLRTTFKPVLPSDLTQEKKKEVLEGIMLLKEKKDGTIKGRNVADGRRQREFIDKHEAASPTAKLESILITSVIDAKEERDVVTIDIPNAFIQTKVENDEDKVIMRMRGRLAEYLVMIAPEIYSPYVMMENGKKVLYCEAQNAVYGTLKAALLFYKKLVKDLQEYGFELNPYDICVLNKMVKGKQQTVIFHVDDMKASHVDAEVNTDLIEYLRSKYEVDMDGLPKLKAKRGKEHEFLGMTLDFNCKGKVMVKMTEYVKEMLQEFQPYIKTKTAKTPAADWLFQTRECNKISEEKAIIFHTMVAKGLFLCKRARPDIHTAIAFLSTRVREPDEDDWKKLIRMMQYLNGTRELYLTLSADDTNILKWFIDASYAIHPDMKGHTGAVFTMGEGGIMNKSIKQKINTRSSSESELISTYDIMPDALWTKYFIEAQGYTNMRTILGRDNQATILWETNGILSSTKRTKHINVRFFFVKDYVERGEVSLEYVPTDKMWADLHTKPLQGSKFEQFRKIVLNLSK